MPVTLTTLAFGLVSYAIHYGTMQSIIPYTLDLNTVREAYAWAQVWAMLANVFFGVASIALAVETWMEFKR